MELLFINEGQTDAPVATANTPAPAPAHVATNATDGTTTTIVVEDGAQQPEAQAPASGGGMGLWIMIIAMIAIMYFFMWRPESKRRKQMQKFREGLKKGDKIITAGGIYGIIKEVHETTVLIEVDGNVTLRVDKGMVVGDPSMGVVNK